MTILVDTREKQGKNDHILTYFDKKGISWERRKLNAGDYAPLIRNSPEYGIMEDIDLSSEIIVERKANLEEISRNITIDKSRIKREFSRAPQNKILLIENSSYSKLVDGDYNTGFAPKAFWASLFSMWHQYGIPVIFLEDKKYTGQFIYGYFYYYARGLFKC